AVALRIGEPGDRRGLLAAEPAAEGAVAALLRSAASRVAGEQRPAVAESVTGVAQRRIVGIDRAFRGPGMEPRHHSIQRLREALLHEVPAAGALGPLGPHLVRKGQRSLPVDRRATAESAAGEDGHPQVTAGGEAAGEVEVLEARQLELVEVGSLEAG